MPEPTPTFAERTVLYLRKHWKQFATFLLPFALGDFLREYVLGKAMDYLLDRLGDLGLWIYVNPFAFLTIGSVIALIWLLVNVAWRSQEKGTSLLVDEKEAHYKIKKEYSSWGKAAVAFLLVVVAFVVYGFYKYQYAVPLLKSFNLGYVILDTDYVTQAVMPLETRNGISEKVEFDFSTVRVLKNTPEQMVLQLPRLLFTDESKILFGQSSVIGGSREELMKYWNGAGFYDGTAEFSADAHIQKYKGNHIVWIIGFNRRVRPPMRHSD